MRPRFRRWATHRPHDRGSIEHYSAPPNFAGLRAARQILRRAAADRLDLLHVATSGPLAVAALILAARSRLPVSISVVRPPRPCAGAVWKSCVRTLAHHSRRVLVTSVAARNAFLRTGVCASKIVDWRPGVDASDVRALEALFGTSRAAGAYRTRVQRLFMPAPCPAIAEPGDSCRWSSACAERVRCTN